MKKIKKLILLGLFLYVSLGASAYSFSAVNEDGVTIYYNIISSTKLTCAVTHKGDYEYSPIVSYSGTVNIPETVTYNGKTYSVTSIGNYTFYGCSGLTSVTNLATEPQQISDDTFIIYGTLHVLKGYKDVYAATDVWKNFTIVDDAEDPTGIEEIIDNGKLIIDNSSVFDLQGKRVERMKQGNVYIHNRRKFIAK